MPPRLWFAPRRPEISYRDLRSPEPPEHYRSLRLFSRGDRSSSPHFSTPDPPPRIQPSTHPVSAH
jgi:hypothetical protein